MLFGALRGPVGWGSLAAAFGSWRCPGAEWLRAWQDQAAAPRGEAASWMSTGADGSREGLDQGSSICVCLLYVMLPPPKATEAGHCLCFSRARVAFP